ncbi:MAG TPA: hypothetical protein VJT50_03260 [Pyrinomonadaceae bacterium]|nr:hypothetical protein [Pyrinomonadaceae bacterium]
MNIAAESAWRKPLVDASGIDSDELLVMICAPTEMRSSFRLGVWARNAREQREDGADDHTPRNHIKLASLCESSAGTVSPRRSRISGGSRTHPVRD